MTSTSHEAPAVVFEAAAAILNASDHASLAAATETAVVRLGYRHLTCATVRRVKQTYLHEANFQTWPVAAVRRFAGQSLFRHDPIIQRSRLQQQAFFWTLDAYDSSIPEHRQIVEIRKLQHIDCGCCVPIVERVGGVANARLVLYVTGTSVEPDERVRLALQMLAGLVCSRLASFSLPPEPRDEQLHFFEATGLLTTRERAVLSWIASGKSSWEIAKILNISEHTVNTHIEKSLVKLDAANRTEAAVKAMVLNKVDLETRDGN